MESPIFIVGANRSGTTLLRLILNAHSRIAIPDELIYLDSRLAGVSIEEWRDPDLRLSAYEALVDDFLSRNRSVLDGLDGLDLESLRREICAGPVTFRRPYQCTLEAWARHHGKSRWGEKTPGNLFYADILLDMFPDAKILYLVRDPRAGVASMQDVSFFPDDVVFNSLSRRKHDVQGRARLIQDVPEAQRMTVRYESLVRQPEAQVRSICQFLGEAFEPSMLRFHEDADRYMKDRAEEDYNAAATQPITDDRIDAWKERLSDDQIAVVESICAPILQAHDYTPTEGRPSFSRRAEMAIKKGYWALQCWRYRDVRHYTVKYPLFARTRTRLQSLRQWARQSVRLLSPFSAG